MKTSITDEIIEKVGSFGRYQLRVLLILSYAMFFCAMTLMVMTFSTAEPPWKCVSNSSACALNGTFKVGDKNYDYRCDLARSEWKFDLDGTFDSIVTEWDLVCDSAVYVSLTNSLTFVVWIFGAMLASIISDKFGRKTVTFSSAVLVCVSGLVSAFAQAYWVFALFRCLVGFGIEPTPHLVCRWLWETLLLGRQILTTKSSERMLILKTAESGAVGVSIWFGASGSLALLPLMAYLIPNWRTLSYITSAPGIFFFLFWWWTPESLRWLLTKGKLGEAKKALTNVARVNRRQFTDKDMDSLVTEGPEKRERLGDVRDLFASRAMTHRTLVSWYGWLVCGMGSYGIALSAPAIGGNMYLNFFLSIATEAVAMVATIYVLNRFGRKLAIVVTLFLSAVSLIAAALLSFYDDGGHGYLAGKIITSMVLGKWFITIAFSGVYIHSSELFPTVVRNTALGSLSSAARVGAACSPYIVFSQRAHALLPFGIMAVNALVSGILYMTLPETNKVSMPDTVKQVDGSDSSTATVDETQNDENPDSTEKNLLFTTSL
ncbi:hypothetical protein QZH41_011636 [Actinostola sp. cb2023]|nr:hypothetical protein QZH41_011636 [Actinostola sp. cb2023]